MLTVTRTFMHIHMQFTRVRFECSTCMLVTRSRTYMRHVHMSTLVCQLSSVCNTTILYYATTLLSSLKTLIKISLHSSKKGFYWILPFFPARIPRDREFEGDTRSLFPLFRPMQPPASCSQLSPRGCVASSLPSMYMSMPFPWPLVVSTRWCQLYVAGWRKRPAGWLRLSPF